MRRAAFAAVAAGLLLLPAASARAFVPNDPFAARQWYLARDRAFDAWPAAPVDLAPVKVAVVDTGVDLRHPQLAGKVLEARSFVGGGVGDTVGHGTFVAGVIAAALDDGRGIAGMAPSARLLVAKVVRPDGTILPEDEARAIRWAADRGARVINLSLGGLRDPADMRRDTYSPEEADAIAYAVTRGALVVAAVGNADDAPHTPWRFASYPAALPHVLGVGALGTDGTVPSFSNRDALYVDLVAPGEGILSLFPRALTARRPACAEQGYSSCATGDYRDGEGTSFAVPQVAAAAADLLALRPDLRGVEVGALLERTAADIQAGCGGCVPGRDAASGFGALDVQAAVDTLAAGPPPAGRDLLEANDDAGEQAPRLWGAAHDLKATLDYWDDRTDVYRIRLERGQLLSAALAGPAGADVALALWRPGTLHVAAAPLEGSASLRALRQRVAQSTRGGAAQRVAYRARESGWFYVEVRLATPGARRYELHLLRS